MYSEDELLPISALQHLAFCERQWGLIHLEGQWAESDRTVEGRHLHHRVHDEFAGEIRGDLIIARAVSLACLRLGLSGVADVVEFRAGGPGDPGVSLPGREGIWIPRPVEYKRGKPKVDDRDEVQVCAQALCLEEMLELTIPFGELFYEQTRHRRRVPFTEDLRQRVDALALHMHELFQAGSTPPAPTGRHCSLCSLVSICLPKLTMAKHHLGRAGDYIDRALNEVIAPARQGDAGETPEAPP